LRNYDSVNETSNMCLHLPDSGKLLTKCRCTLMVW